MAAMRTKLCVVCLVVAPAIAQADGDGFVQGVVGYSEPIAGAQYTDGVHGGARVGVRGGWLPVVHGQTHFGIEGGLDWRPLDTMEGSVQNLRALVGPRVAFVAEPAEVFFRLTAGYDHLYLGDYVNDTGIAIEPGFGALYRWKGLRFGA